MKNNHIPEFEGLRGLMAWWVVLGHMSQFAGFGGSQIDSPWYQSIILRGGVPVSVFITISGFVIFSLLTHSSKFTYKTYITARFFRLYPAYIIAFILALLTLPLVSTVITAPWTDSTIAATKIARLISTEENLFRHIALHITLLHGFIPDQILPYSGDAILGPAWSLSLEWQFYLFAPFLCSLFASKNKTAFAGICLVLFLAKLYFIKQGIIFSYGSFLPVYFEFFLLGIISFYAWERATQQNSFYAGVKILLIALLAAFLVMAFTGGMREHFYPVAIWTLVFGSALWQRITGKITIISRILSLRPVQHIGHISYSTYIVHVVVITIVGWFMVNYFDIEKITSNTALLIMLVIGTPIIYLLSLALNKFVEKPGINFGKSLNARISSNGHNKVLSK